MKRDTPEANQCNDLKETIRSILLAAGACAVGFVRIENITESERQRFDSWIERGDNAGMDYMRNYPELRFNPSGMMENAATMISLAFTYGEATPGCGIAGYAFYEDYHKGLRKALKPALKRIAGLIPDAGFRICIDSAPVMERYWAQKAGIGFRGDNGALIVPGAGSRVFLAEVITNIPIVPDSPCEDECGHCGACVKACPGNAINGDGTIDCRRCISYLTIEHRGDWELEESVRVMNTPEGKASLFGCDRCLSVCPHNAAADCNLKTVLGYAEGIEDLTPDAVMEIADDEELKQKFPHSPISRAGAEGLKRNARNTNLNNKK